MKTRPESPLTPGLPLKSHVAYAVVIEPPSEWPPTTTWRPFSFASRTTFRRSWISVFIPHCFAYWTSESGTGCTWCVMVWSVTHFR